MTDSTLPAASPNAGFRAALARLSRRPAESGIVAVSGVARMLGADLRKGNRVTDSTPRPIVHVDLHWVLVDSSPASPAHRS